MQLTTDKIKVVKKRLEITQSQYKSYVDFRRRLLEFDTGDWVFLKVSLSKGITKFSKRGKLNLRDVEPYQILNRIGAVAYLFDLPQELTNIYNVFHVSMLWR